ncbi:MAG: class I SAM-dependent methyltransferase [Acidimicrobiales bacterium]
MVEESGWITITKSNPNHSAWYIERFQAMEAAGDDLAGEARFVDAMAPRGARILDAGCGTGRVGAALAELGHDVVGVDVDPELIAAAEEAHSGPTWFVGDLAELDLASKGIGEGFDIIVAAGNVMTFLAPSTRREVLTRLRTHLRQTGRLVLGFGAGRGYEFDEFFSHINEVGLVLELKLSTWDMRPFTDDSDFLVGVFRRG